MAWFAVQRMTSPVDEKEDWVWIKFFRTPESEVVFKRLISALETLYEPERRFSMLITTEYISDVPLSWSKQIGQWMQENEKLAKLYLKHTCVVAPEVFIRLFLSALFLFRKPVTRVDITETMAQARTKLGWDTKK